MIGTKASIISVGNELLNGQTVDSNMTWLSGRLLTIGIPVISAYTIGDDVEAIKDCIEKAATQAEIILITGGLGPTDDDITREAIAEYLGSELVFVPEIYETIKGSFKRIDYPMPEKNKVQAYIPTGTESIENKLGTAVGILYQNAQKLIAAMPGVPIEMKGMMNNSVMPKVKQMVGDSYVIVKKIKCFGCGESALAEKLGDLMVRGRNPLINCTVSTGMITLHIVATGNSKSEAENDCQKDVQMLKDLLGDWVYGYDDETLAGVVAKKLIENGQTLALAESCTGGLVAKWITDVAGASEFFNYGWVTYSGQAKISQLNVPEKTIENFGQVSEETALAMAKGAKNKANSDFAIAITGIAGPTGGTEEKPVGLVYIAIEAPNGSYVHKFNYTRPNRDFIRTITAQTALNLLRLNLGV